MSLDNGPSSSMLRSLQHRAIQPHGFDCDLDDRRSHLFRRAAWLYLLHVRSNLDLDPTPSEAGVTQGPTRSSPPPAYSESEASHTSTSADSTAAASSSSATGGAELANSLHQPASTPASSPRPNLARDAERIPIDKDGWQIAALDALTLQDGEGSGAPSMNRESSEEWETVVSKKTRALRRRKGGRASSTVPGAEDDDARQPVRATGDASPSSPELDTHKSPENSSTPASRRAKKKKREKHATSTSGNIDDDAAAEQRRGSPSNSALLAALPPHRDEEQVDKDIRRSFVGPAFAGQSAEERASRRQALEDVVLLTLRRHPSLHYYQGYHDIVSVLVLVLQTATASRAADDDDNEQQAQRELQLAVERLSLHFVRDSMTADLDAVMGQLKLLRNLLRLADAPTAERVERASALPFWALSWLLTLFSHDVDDQRAVWRCFDFVLAHGPASIIYLCAAVVLLVKKRELEAMDEEESEDPALLHLLLSRMPTFLLDDEEEAGEDSEDQEQPPPRQGGEDQGEAALYADPDVDPPTGRSDTLRRPASRSRAHRREGSSVQLLAVLRRAKVLMDAHPLSSPGLDGGSDGLGSERERIMGDGSVLYTWPRLIASAPDPAAQAQTHVQAFWAAQIDAASLLSSGRGEVVVHNPHPTPPPSSLSPDDDDDATREKRPRRRFRLLRLDTAAKRGDVVLGSLVAVVAVAGVGMALYLDSSRGANLGAEGAASDVLRLVGGALRWLGGPGGGL